MEVFGAVVVGVQVTSSALRAYVKFRGRHREYGNKVEYVKQLIQTLRALQVHIENEAKALLCVADVVHNNILLNTEVDHLTGEQCLNLLEDPEIRQQVAAYLGNVYEFYEAGLRRCLREIESVSIRLSDLVVGKEKRCKLDPKDLDGLVKAQKEAQGKLHWKKSLKFEIDVDDIKKQIQSLKEATRSLPEWRAESHARYVAESSRLASSRIARLDNLLQRARSHAPSLYQAMVHACFTNCHDEHRLRLFLASRTGPLNELAEPLLISSVLEPYNTRLSIELLEPKSRECAAQPQIQGLNLPAAISQATPDALIQGEGDVINLCPLVSWQNQSEILHLELAHDDRLKLRHSSLGGTTRHEYCSNPKKHISLGDSMLQIGPNMGIAIGVYLTSSFLQLFSTSWMENFWTKDRILLPLAEAINAELRIAQDTPPFIRHSFPAPCLGLGSHNVERALLELGIVLIEMMHRGHIEEYARLHQLELTDTYSHRQEVAKHWLNHETTRERMLPFYYDIVDRCIQCTFDMRLPNADLKDADFRHSMCRDILIPLWTNCQKNRIR